MADLNDKPPWAALEPPQPNDLLEPEFRPAYEAYKASPSPQTAGPLLQAVSPVLDEALRSYAGTEARSATAKAQAKRFALEAVRRYDPGRAKLRTHLLSHLRGLRRVVERGSGGVYVPEQWRIDGRMVSAAYTDMREELGRDPSDAEVADRTSIPVGRVRKAKQVPLVLSGSQSDGEGVAVSTPDERSWNKWIETVYHDLEPRDQVILEHSFGLFGKPVLTANNIAGRLNLSPGAISLRKAKIQNMLDEYDSFMGRRA